MIDYQKLFELLAEGFKIKLVVCKSYGRRFG